MDHRRATVRAIAGLLLLVPLAASGLAQWAPPQSRPVPAENLSIFSPVSPSASAIRDLSYLIFAITGFIFVVVGAVLCYSALRFRVKRKDSSGGMGKRSLPVSSTEAEPPQVYGSHSIEIAWTAAPAAIVFVMMLVTTRTLWEVEVPPPQPKAGDGALFVTVIGHQWWWEYRYDHYDGRPLGFITANELHVPAGEAGAPRPVYLTLESADVCHSFWVPRLAGKTDLIPGRTNHMWFQTDQPGLYLGQCAEYCGAQHADMLLRVYVDPADEFAHWLTNEERPAFDDPSAADAKARFLALSCVNCHRIRGTPAAGTYAPDLTHLMSRQTLASGIVPNDLRNLDDWVRDPQSIKPGCLMPAFGLSDEDRDLVVQYLRTLD
jgi:cytochrome c oxidase subunit II